MTTPIPPRTSSWSRSPTMPMTMTTAPLVEILHCSEGKA
jgi:hypothetical protein